MNHGKETGGRQVRGKTIEALAEPLADGGAAVPPVPKSNVCCCIGRVRGLADRGSARASIKTGEKPVRASMMAFERLNRDAYRTAA